MMRKKLLEEKQRFIQRDLSWLSFNERVLEESLDPQNPLMERIKFLAIFVNNLDEFYMVRVAGLKNLISSAINKKDRFGYYPQELFSEIKDVAGQLIKKLYDIYSGKVLRELQKNGIRIKKFDDLRAEQKRFVKQYFETTLYPIITPMAVDPGHPFPILPSKTLAFAMNVTRKGQQHLAIIPIPKNVPRLIALPTAKDEYDFILVEDVIRGFLKVFFQGYRLRSTSLFRIIRDSEFSVEEEFTPDLLKAIEEEVKKRTRSKVVYMEVEKDCGDELLEMLCERLPFPITEVNRIESNLGLSFLFELTSVIDKPELFFPGYIPGKIEYDNIFDKIKEEDFMIHLPFQSFQPTIDFIETAAKDDNVLAIKMTLYRTDKDSTIIQALKEAAENKKQVTVLVEIKARFDEENNIRWVRELEEAGCHVIYGIPGLKIHSKMTLVVRKEEGSIHRYVHLSTGNYNENTARVYSDIGYFTANEDFAKDISDVFNVVTGYSMPSPWKRVISSPNDLRDYFFSLIDREIHLHKKNKNGLIIAKMNSLEDPKMIERLYKASQAGVKVKLIVRGICCLIPGVKGLSENIKVRSIVGRFLEHSRIFMFSNNGSPRVFLSSADWMRRNLDRRVELLFELYKEEIKEQLIGVLNAYWKDNVKAKELSSDRKYRKSSPVSEKFNIQEHLIKDFL